MDAETRAVLVSMKTALSSRGWVQGSIEAEGGEVCLFGALIRGTSMPPSPLTLPVLLAPLVRGRGNVGGTNFHIEVDSPAGKALKLIAQALDMDVLNLAIWNDAEGRDVKDITDVIDRLLVEGTEAKAPTPDPHLVKRLNADGLPIYAG